MINDEVTEAMIVRMALAVSIVGDDDSILDEIGLDLTNEQAFLASKAGKLLAGWRESNV